MNWKYQILFFLFILLFYKCNSFKISIKTTSDGQTAPNTAAKLLNSSLDSTKKQFSDIDVSNYDTMTQEMTNIAPTPTLNFLNHSSTSFSPDVTDYKENSQLSPSLMNYDTKKTITQKDKFSSGYTTPFYIDISPKVTDIESVGDQREDAGGSIKSHSRFDLEVIEHELETKKESSNKDLLLAISILQHHLIPNDIDDKEFEKGNAETNVAKSTPTNFTSTKKKTFSYSVEINDLYSSKQNLPEEFFKDGEMIQFSNNSASNIDDYETEVLETPSQFHWFVLVLEGDCSIIRQRMSTFVTFLKAALSAKLETSYEDIFVPSVFCDRTFMINVTLDTGKYPTAPLKLHTLAEANTTLLEISGEIFYLEKILVKKPASDIETNAYLRRNGDVEIVIYIAVGCMCFFIFLSVITAFLVRICRQDDDLIPEKRECYERPEYMVRRPKVIYSPTFSQGLDLEKCCLRQDDQNSENHSNGVAPSSSGTLGSYNRYNSEKESATEQQYYERKSYIIPSSSKLKLLEEVQEEEEEDIEDDDDDDLVDDYQEENDDTEVEDIDDGDDSDDDVSECVEETQYISSNLDQSCLDMLTESQNDEPPLNSLSHPFCLTSSSNRNFEHPHFNR